MYLYMYTYKRSNKYLAWIYPNTIHILRKIYELSLKLFMKKYIHIFTNYKKNAPIDINKL